MSLPAFDLKSWREPYWFTTSREPGDGSFRRVYHGHLLAVEIFTYTGGPHGAEFTQLTTYLCQHTHRVRLPKWYHPRWHGRLAGHFEHLCWAEAEKQGRLP